MIVDFTTIVVGVGSSPSWLSLYRILELASREFEGPKKTALFSPKGEHLERVGPHLSLSHMVD